MTTSVPVSPSGSDDSAGLQAAIDTAGPGGLLQFGTGTYLLSTALVPVSGQLWNMGVSTLARIGADRLVTATGVTDWNVFGGAFSGGASQGLPSCGSLVSVEAGSARVSVRCSTFVDSVDPALRFVNSSWCSAIECHVEHVGSGVVVDWTDPTMTSLGCRIIDLAAHSCAGDVASINGAQHMVRGVIAQDYGGAAVEIAAGSVGCMVSQVTADSEGHSTTVVLDHTAGGVLVDTLFAKDSATGTWASAPTVAPSTPSTTPLVKKAL